MVITVSASMPGKRKQEDVIKSEDKGKGKEKSYIKKSSKQARVTTIGSCWLLDSSDDEKKDEGLQ